MMLKSKQQYICCESGVLLSDTDLLTKLLLLHVLINRFHSFELWFPSLPLVMDHSFITLVYFNVRSIITNQMINSLTGHPYVRKRKRRSKKKVIKDRPWYINYYFLHWIIFLLSPCSKCGKQNWWLCNALRGKGACFELTTPLTASMLKLEISCQKYHL